MDLSGMITAGNREKLRDELQKLAGGDWKAVALRMTDVKAVDDEGFSVLTSFLADLAGAGRFCAVLDPSAAADAFLASRGLDKSIRVFGTESAFEEKAFS
jgi:anti-anti-sigma regulatory factor